MRPDGPVLPHQFPCFFLQLILIVHWYTSMSSNFDSDGTLVSVFRHLFSARRAGQLSTVHQPEYTEASMQITTRKWHYPMQNRHVTLCICRWKRLGGAAVHLSACVCMSALCAGPASQCSEDCVEMSPSQRVRAARYLARATRERRAGWCVGDQHIILVYRNPARDRRNPGVHSCAKTALLGAGLVTTTEQLVDACKQEVIKLPGERGAARLVGVACITEYQWQGVSCLRLLTDLFVGYAVQEESPSTPSI